jgi:regulator of replication initiation timing
LGGNYEKDLFRHLQETLEKVDRLATEIEILKANHHKEVEVLKVEIHQLKKENATLKQENSRLKEIVNKDSSNSSKPPSSDGFKKIQNSREKTGKRPGGQFGHKGTKPKFFDNPTRVVEVKTPKCSCGGPVRYSDKYTIKQQVDLNILVDITEYR